MQKKPLTSEDLFSKAIKPIHTDRYIPKQLQKNYFEIEKFS